MYTLRLWLCLWVLASWSASPVAADDSERCLSTYENAQLLRLRGHYLAARDALLVCTQSCPALLSRDCVTWLPEVEASLSSVVFAVTDRHGRDLQHVRVYANGKVLEIKANGRAVPFNPGVYKLRFEAAGFAPQEQSLTVRESEKNRIVRAQLRGEDEEQADESEGAVPPTSADLPKGARIPTASYVLGGVSLASLGAFTYFAIAGKNEHDRLDRTCAPNCKKSEAQQGKLNYVLADVAIGVSVAAAAAAVWIYVAKRRSTPSPLGDAQVHVDGEGAMLSWGKQF